MGPVEVATMSFGQGLTATPLQLAAAYAAIANGGTWYRPHVMRRIVDGSGGMKAEAKVEGRRVIALELARTMRGMLEAVTQKGGTGEKLVLPGYRFAGKTGTAQKVDPVTRHYSTDKWASSFVGFAPLEDPRLVIFVMVDEPQGTHYGSMVAGPIFRDTAIDALRWLGVPPSPSVPDAKAAPVAKREPPPARAAAPPEETTEEDDTPEDGYVAASDDPRVHGRTEVPDFSGMSVGEALQAARRAGVRVEVLGSGYANSQSPGPGAARRGSACRVQFTPPG
jgi:cell division protein FtsI (penicillin-binding protein 3)